jgi:DNA-binding IclR family transcriptional regulator
VTDMVRGSAARALLALVGGAQTVRQVADTAGMSYATAWRYLVVLRRLGLVSWESGKDGTLRPMVTIEPIQSEVA